MVNMSDYESSETANNQYHESHDVKETLTKATIGYKEGSIPQIHKTPQEIAHIRFSTIMTGAMLYGLSEEIDSLDEKVDIEPVGSYKEYLETAERQIDTFEDCLDAYLEPFRDNSFPGNSGSGTAGP